MSEVRTSGTEISRIETTDGVTYALKDTAAREQISKLLLTVTEADNGKILCVQNGVWTAVDITQVLPNAED